MKRKKLLSALIALTMVLSIMFTGCGKEPGKDGATGKNEEIKVGFLYVGPIGDGGWSFTHDEGRKFLEKELNVPTVYQESVKEDLAEVEKICEDMINQGCNVIMGTSFGFMDGMEASAKKHPDVKYLHCSGYKTAENMSNYFGRIYQARYLSGIVAGMKTETNKIGYVAAFPIPEVVRGINAFTLGVRSVNPDAVVKVNWTSTWYDPAREKESAKALIDDGVDVIAQHQDTAGPQQAAEDAGIFSIGYNTDMSKIAPKANMTSPVWNWGPYYVDQINRIKDGTWKPESYWGGIEDGITDLSELTENAPDGAREKVKDERENIISGKNKIFQGPIKDQSGNVKVKEGEVMTDKQLLEFDWFVEGVVGKIENKENE